VRVEDEGASESGAGRGQKAERGWTGWTGMEESQRRLREMKDRKERRTYITIKFGDFRVIRSRERLVSGS